MERKKYVPYCIFSSFAWLHKEKHTSRKITIIIVSSGIVMPRKFQKQYTLSFRQYSIQRKTTHMRISYYVKENFHQEFTGSLRRLERQIEEEYMK